MLPKLSVAGDLL